MKGPHSPMAASHGTVVKVRLLPLWGHGTRRDRAKGQPFRGHGAAPGFFKDTRGRYYAGFAVEVDKKPLPSTGKAVASTSQRCSACEEGAPGRTSLSADGGVQSAALNTSET